MFLLVLLSMDCYLFLLLCITFLLLCYNSMLLIYFLCNTCIYIYFFKGFAEKQHLIAELTTLVKYFPNKKVYFMKSYLSHSVFIINGRHYSSIFHTESQLATSNLCLFSVKSFNTNSAPVAPTEELESSTIPSSLNSQCPWWEYQELQIFQKDHSCYWGIVATMMIFKMKI